MKLKIKFNPHASCYDFFINHEKLASRQITRNQRANLKLNVAVQGTHVTSTVEVETESLSCLQRLLNFFHL